MNASGAQICVVHLARRGNPGSAFQTFIDSYRLHSGDIGHDLLIVFKGYSPSDDLSAYDLALEGVPHRRTFLPDFGYDIRPYVIVARKQPHAYLMLLNSFSRVLAPGWLALFFRAVRRPGVGLVGATGSHQSVNSDYHALQAELRETGSTLRRVAVGSLRYARYVTSIRGRFGPFPNYHIRTNAFMVRREILAGMKCGLMLRKWNAYAFESGVNSLTRNVMNVGLRALVVGADGGEYEAPEWADASTFWIREQENLLVSDNQTRAYAEGSSALRDRLAYYAWRRRPDGSARTDVPPLH